MSNIAINVKDLNVKYREINQFSLKQFFSRKKNDKYFHALKGISFQIEEGEIVGIVGTNGSGKSTLLNTIAGIFSPDSGSIDLGSRSVALLSIGAGFEKGLSGRDNIMLSGLLLGFTEKQINEKMQDIIDFSELKDFIDKPVRAYSKGMYSKLAFSISSNLESDVILIDEVLSVGDEHFKKKSLKRIKEIISDKKHTVLIVSHNLSTLKKLCTKAIWIDNGSLKMIGDSAKVIDEYKKICK